MVAKLLRLPFTALEIVGSSNSISASAILAAAQSGLVVADLSTERLNLGMLDGPSTRIIFPVRPGNTEIEYLVYDLMDIYSVRLMPRAQETVVYVLPVGFEGADINSIDLARSLTSLGCTPSIVAQTRILPAVPMLSDDEIASLSSSESCRPLPGIIHAAASLYLSVFSKRLDAHAGAS
ncbi:hypothetical protein [Azorhizobium oxalatiphilum]|uniref:hypothetical protein n=1 Tax=Azorhizobium oxalatiphilum TaxID=980631 RepID=UPI0016636C08|nr:hypothetical protein [Azorhizobium oxalatiphilum]